MIDPGFHHPRSTSAGGPADGRARRVRGPRPVSDLLGGAMRSLGVPSVRVTEAIRHAWEGALEEGWRDATRLLRLHGGVLEIAVASDALHAELTNFHRDRLLAVMRKVLPDVPLVGLRFVTDPADGGAS